MNKSIHQEFNVPEKIIVHHSASEDLGTLDFMNMWNWQVNHKGWLDIGYHYVIELLPFGRYTILMGRMPTKPGAHCPGMNTKSLGVCFTGNFEEDRVPPAQWGLGVGLVGYLCQIYSLTPADIDPHRKYKNTACPGQYFSISDFRADVAAELNNG